MKVLTEEYLRSSLKNSKCKEFIIDKGVIVTPSARQYIQDKGIKLVVREDNFIETKEISLDNKKEIKSIGKFKFLDIGYFDVKPEFMTSLYGNEIVFKDHSIIELRGRLDSLQAKTLSVQILANKLDHKKVVDDLQDILDYERNIMIAEIKKEELIDSNIIGYTFKEIREMSHNPKKFFGIDHIWYPDYNYGELFAALNEIRTQIREVEVSAIKAFKGNSGEIQREDILRALNRLSSCMYVMMCKLISKTYGK